MKRFLLVCLVALLGGGTSLPARAAQHAGGYCAFNTGLDPACPSSAVGIELAATPLTDAATQRGDTVFTQLAWHADNQITVSIPAHEQLAIAGVGDANGTGDIGFAYTRLFTEHGRLSQVLGVSLSVPSGSAAFTNGRLQIVPLYSLSYALGGHVHLVLLNRYGFDAGETRLPFAARTQTLDVTPRAIVDISKYGVYAAVSGQALRVTGDYRYEAYDAMATLGIVRNRYHLSVSYGVPLTAFSYDHLFRHTIGVQLYMQR